jgi:hypothetical protein
MGEKKDDDFRGEELKCSTGDNVKRSRVVVGFPL